MERWQTILDGWYAISDWGRIKRLRPRHDARRSNRFRPYLVEPTISGKGYLSFMPSIKGEQSSRLLVHILVAASFIGPCPRGKEVNHKDGVKSNNRWKNLEYLTRRENMKHAVRIGLPVGRPSFASLALVKRS